MRPESSLKPPPSRPTRGVGRLSLRRTTWDAKTSVLLHHAQVFVHRNARLPGQCRGEGVGDAQLHPDGGPATSESLFNDGRDLFALAEDIHNIDRDVRRDTAQVGVGLLTQNLRDRRVHGNDTIALIDQVSRDLIGVLVGVVR